MRALQVQKFGDPSFLQIGEVPERPPGRGEVMLRMAGVGVGYFDGLLIKGEYQIKPPLPFVPGSAVSGVVEALGEGVEHLQVGDPVAAFIFMGGLAEKITLPAASCFHLPPEVDLEGAANFFVPYATALYGFRECGRLSSGETVLVLGASGTTGTTAIEVAKAMGARVIACASTEEKRQHCLAAGADEVVDYTAEDWRKEAKRLAGSQGINVVFDPVGGELAEPALRLLSPGGRFLVVGFVAGIARIPLNLPLLKQCSVIGVNWGGAVMTRPAVVAPVIEQLTDWSCAGKLNLVPDRKVPLAEAASVFADLFARRSPGKIVITP